MLRVEVASRGKAGYLARDNSPTHCFARAALFAFGGKRALDIGKESFKK